MRVFRLLLISLAALLTLALLAAWQIPGRLDWNRYRGTVEAVASATLGRPVTIAGPITLSLLPEPELTAADVVVAGSAPGENPVVPALTVRALRLRVAPLPLLSGRVDARELALSGPDLAIGWPLLRGGLADWPPYWLSAFSARIEKGRLRVGGLLLEGIDATLATTEAGGFVAVGSGRLGGQAIRFAARLTAAGSDGAAGLNLTIEALDRLAGLTGGFAGQLASNGAVTGRIDISGPDFSRLIPAPAGQSPAGAFKIATSVNATGEKAVFDGLTIDRAGPDGAATLGGTATLRLTPDLRLDGKLSAGLLELDPWMSVLARMSGSGLTIGLELKAEAVAFGGGLMRRLSAALEMTPSQIVLREVAVQLPGEADLRLTGVLQRGDPARPHFDGSVQVAAPRLREVLRWLDSAGLRVLPDLPDGVLNSADFRAHAVVEPGLLALDRMEGRVDGTAMNGELRWTPQSRTGAAGAVNIGPSIVASLELGSLLLDPWLDPWLADGSSSTGEPGRAFEVDLRLRAPVARWRGEEMTALSLDATMQAPIQIGPAAATQAQPPLTPAPLAGMGRVTLRQLEATVRGVRLVASGTVAEGGRLTEGKLLAATDDASGLASLVPLAWRPSPAFWRGPATLNAQLSGPMEAMGLKLTLDMADARLEASPVIDLRGGKWVGPMTLRHPGAPRLLGLLGMTGAEAWLGEGSLSLIAQVSGARGPGGGGRIATDMLDVTAGLMRLSAPLVLDMTGEMPVLNGRIQADTLALPEPAWRDATPLPFALLSGWRASVKLNARQVLVGRVPVLTQVAGTASLGDGVLRVDPFNAVLAGGALSGTLAAAGSADPPTLAVTATLIDANAGGPAGAAEPGSLPLDLLAGRVNADMELSAAGHSLAAIMATLSGGVTLNVTDGVLSGFDLFRVTRAVVDADRRTRLETEATLRAAVAEGVTNFAQLSIRAEAQSGTLTLREAALTGIAGTANFSGSVGLGTRMLDLRMALRPSLEAPPEIAFRLTGPWEKPRRSPEFAGFLRWLAGPRTSLP